MTRLFVAAMLLFACSVPTLAQEKPREASSDIPALADFHTVIYEIWHGAWPAKDTTRLASLLPQVDEGVTALAKVQLPGILRERKNAWDERLAQLKSTAQAYRSAVDNHQGQALLDAAERLHMGYEKLVQAVRPPLKELDAFHTDLYMLYHYYVPGDSLAKMQESAMALKAKMETLEAASLPPRLKVRQDAFASSRAELSKAVEAFAAASRGGDLQSIKQAAAAVHDKYQALAQVLE